jgi:hypothetical protein
MYNIASPQGAAYFKYYLDADFEKKSNGGYSWGLKIYL